MRRFLFFIVALLFVIPVLGQGSSEKIHEFNSTIDIQKSGAIIVKEEIYYDFGYSYRHGIYRDIPQIVYRENNNKYVLDYKVRSVMAENGRQYKYTLLHENNYLRIKIGDPDRTITGPHIYIITYEVKGALNYFNDHTELYWNSTGDQWDVPIDSARTTVILPQVVTGPDIKVACYTGAHG